MKNSKPQNTGSVKKTRLELLHQYYTYTGFYKFLGASLKKAIPPIIGFIAVLIFINYFVININDALIYVTENYTDYVIFTVFFASESLLGLIPPELFIAWSDKSSNPILYLSILALLSYCGGIVSYFIGRWVAKIPSFHHYLEVKMAKHIKNTRKWGGFLIIVGALLPIPFSITSIAAGMINYSFTNYLLFGLLRFLRFYLYALAIFNLV